MNVWFCKRERKKCLVECNAMNSQSQKNPQDIHGIYFRLTPNLIVSKRNEMQTFTPKRATKENSIKDADILYRIKQYRIF